MKYVNCPSCGGKIHFDIGLQKVKCEYCDSVFEPEELEGLQDGVEDTMPGEEEVTVFSCPSCGAQVTGEDISAVEYCQYCGSFVTFNSRIEKIRRPDYIAPFEISRERCEEIYKERINGTLYVPKDLKNGEGKIEFHPMFIPFWNMEVEFPGENKVSADERWTEGSYSCSRNYNVEFETDGKVTNCLFDASKALDDNISDCIGDYDPEKLVEYNPSYMHGAFADMADVEAKFYEEDAKNRCFNTLTESIRGAFGSSGEGLKFHDHQSVSIEDSSSLRESKVTSRLSMFPVWFMTFKNKDRVAYSVVNGQTGSIFTETPVDLVKFFAFSMLMALPIFGVLELFATFRPTTMLGVISIITAVVLIMYTVIAGGEWDRDHRVPEASLKTKAEDDKEPEKTEKKVPKKDSKFSKSLERIKDFFIIAFIGLALLFGGIFVLASMRIVALIVVLIVMSSKYKKFDKPAKSLLIRESLLGIIAILITIVFQFYDPVFDWYYYAAAIISMIGMIISIGFVVKRYNRRVTHPVPHFFNGKDGDIA